MADERGLHALNPYELQDQESERLRSWFESLDAEGWSQASACEGWTRKDLLGHLVAVEEYFTACLEGTVVALIQRHMQSGATSLDAFNQAGVDAVRDIPPAALLKRWVEPNRANRAGFSAADGTDIDTSVGAYPCRLQAFHAAAEYAIHADDVDAPVAPNEADGRQAWLAAVARFALTETKQDVAVEETDSGYEVQRAGQASVFDRDTLVAGVFSRTAGLTISHDELDLLSLGY